MKLSKNILEIRKFASQNDLRPEISCTYLKDNKIVATDATRLVEITDKKLPEELFIKEPLLLPIRKIKLDKENEVIISDDKKTATIGTKDTMQIVKTVEGSYPEYENIMPKPDTNVLAEVSIDGELLGEVLEYMQKFGGYKGVKMTIYDKNNYPIKIEVNNPEYKVIGLVMPLNK